MPQTTTNRFTGISIRFALTIALITMGGITFGASAAMAANGNSTHVSDELLVQIKAGVSGKKVKALFSSHGATELGDNMPIRVHRIRVPAKALDRVKAALSKNPNVSFVEYNYLAQGGFIPDDADYSSQWALPKISAPAGWDIETGVATEPIAIIDSGVDATHPDLAGKVIGGYNFLSGNTDTHDVLGHGTAVAGTAAAASNNSIGVAGLAWGCPVMPLVVLDANDWATYANIAQAITYAVDMGVRVINISIGGSSSSATLQSAVNYAWNNGAMVFACAQNYATSAPYYPAACTNAIAVSATTSSDTLASFSDYGSWIDIAAPGVSILTTNNGGGYGYWNGTSFSSPLAAGLAALILSLNPQLTNTQVVKIIEDNADDLGPAGFDDSFGYGRIDVAKSLQAAQNATAQPDTTAPSATITSPSTGATVSGTVTVDVSASDNTGVTSVELYVDNALLDISTSSPYQFAWDTTGVSDGTHTLKAVAKDAAGNAGTSTTVTVTVQNTAPAADTIAPVVTIISPSNGDVIKKGVNIKASATDNDSVASMAVYVDGSLMSTATGASISCHWNTRKASKGTHTITVKATDPSGNVGSQSITVSI